MRGASAGDVNLRTQVRCLAGEKIHGRFVAFSIGQQNEVICQARWVAWTGSQKVAGKPI
jgi:hypothetical protein